jgi:hypothetical protein
MLKSFEKNHVKYRSEALKTKVNMQVVFSEPTPIISPSDKFLPCCLFYANALGLLKLKASCLSLLAAIAREFFASNYLNINALHSTRTDMRQRCTT